MTGYHAPDNFTAVRNDVFGIPFTAGDIFAGPLRIEGAHYEKDTDIHTRTQIQTVAEADRCRYRHNHIHIHIHIHTGESDRR